MHIVLDFQSLPYFQNRYPRQPVRILLAEARESIASLLDDASRLNLGRDTQSQLTAALSYLDKNQNAGRAAYEHARSTLFRALQEKNPSLWQVAHLDENGGFHNLSPEPEVIHIQPSTGPKKRPIAVLDANISESEIAFAKKRLVGCPDDANFDHFRFAALAPLVRPLVAAGNGRAAIALWLRLHGFAEFLSAELTKITVAKIKTQIKRDDAMAGAVMASTSTAGISATL